MELVNTPPTAAEKNADESMMGKAQNWISNWRTLSRDNKSVLAIALLAAVMAATIVVILWTASQHYVPLYGKQELYDKANILELLEQEELPFRLDNSSGQILVPESHLAQIRMSLAARGVKMTLPTGLEGLDGKTGLGTSQFMETMRYRHALEGELARTIITLEAVRSARVHLAVPKRTLFVGRNEEKPTASVMLDLAAGRTLEQGQVESIVNLVAGSVSGMKPEGVSVVDQAGRLLSANMGENNGIARLTMQQMDYTHQVEQRIMQRASDMLYPLVGMDNFRVQVTADLDFSAVEETRETLNPESVVSRENAREDLTRDVLALGVPGSLSNLPPIKKPEGATADGQNGESGSNESNTLSHRNEFSKEYETGRSVIHKKYEQGRINQLSVAIILNNAASPGGQGWSEADMAQIESTLKGALGISDNRDQFSLNSFAFAVQPKAIETPEMVWWQEPIWRDYLRYGVGGILGLALVLLGIRPLVRHLIRIQSPEEENMMASAQPVPQALPGATDMAGGMAGALGGDSINDSIDDLLDEVQGFGSAAAGAGGGGVVNLEELPPPGSEFDVQLQHLQLLAEKETARVAEVVKLWVNGNERD